MITAVFLSQTSEGYPALLAVYDDGEVVEWDSKSGRSTKRGNILKGGTP